MRKLLILIFCILISVGLIYTNTRYKTQGKIMEEYDAAARSLRVKRSSFEYELRKVEEELRNVVIGKGHGTILFEELNEEIYNTCLDQFKSHSLTGTLGLSLKELPEKEGKLSLDDFRYLVAHKWDLAVIYDGEEELDIYLDKLRKELDDLQIDLPDKIYFKYAAYHQSYDEDLIRNGFSTVIHHGEEELPVITKSDDTEIFHLGAVSWNIINVKKLLTQAMEGGGSIVITVDFNSQFGKYYEELFGNMLNFMVSEKKRFYIGDLNEARDNLSMAEQNDYLLARKEYLISEITRLDEEIYNIYQIDKGDILDN